MLFDLRSRRRRRLVKGVYVFLAVLIAAGLVGFGIGSGSSLGGLLSGAGKGGGTGTGEDTYLKALAAAQKKTKAHPGNAAAWVAVGNALYSISQLPDHYVTGQGYTAAGLQTLTQLRQAWTRYIALAPAQPDQHLALAVATVFGTQPPAGILDYKTAESAQEIIAEFQPSQTQYEYLAYFAYNAKEIPRGDLAAARALALTPKSGRAAAQVSLTRIKDTALGITGATGSTGSSSSSTSSSTTTSSATTHSSSG
jgi:hypothetical protein